MGYPGNVFISYRREDAAAHAGRLCDHLSATIGAERVFMDVDDIGPGQDFAETIDRWIAGCGILLMVIGPRWSEILGERAQQREKDFVRQEVASALAHGLKIVPVLVGGAAMPRPEELPEGLSELPFRQAAELRDTAFRDDCDRLARDLRLKGRRGKLDRRWGLAAGAALLVVVGAVSLKPLWKTPPDPRMETARTQTELGEHRSAYRTYGEILRSGAADAAVMERQADAAMAWLREFRVALSEGQSAEEVAGKPLEEIIATLEAALARSGGREQRAGDLLAHLGWAHWLVQKLAHKTFGPAAEKALRRSVVVDPENVYGHAMLGNWLLQNGGDVAEALRHFEAAEKTKRERPLVRQMELGGMIYNHQPGIPAALMRIMNRMRLEGEPLEARVRSRLLSYFRPGNDGELQQMLTAVAPGEAWATFEWLDSPAPGEAQSFERFRREYVKARVLEVEGKGAEALEALGDLEKRLRDSAWSGRLLDDVVEARKRVRGGK